MIKKQFDNEMNLPLPALRFFRWLSRLRPQRESRGAGRLRSQESGFAYLMALFMVLLVLIASSGAMLNLRTDRRRQREDELIWRGNQYVRAIRLYYRKAGHYPQNLDELQKGLPELHFLRSAAYKDPVNNGDGAWRLIYVNAAGQIIGSVRYASLQQMALMDLNGGKMPTTSSGLPAMSSASPLGLTNTIGQGLGSSTGAQSDQSAASPSPGGSTSPGSGPVQNSTSLQPNQNSQAPPPAQSGAGVFGNPVAQQPTGPIDSPVIGGFLTGVVSAVDQTSIKVYKGGTKYTQWEFIWNPIEDQARVTPQGLGQLQLPNLLGVPGSTTDTANPGSGGLLPGGPASPGTMGPAGPSAPGIGVPGGPGGPGSPPSNPFQSPR